MKKTNVLCIFLGFTFIYAAPSFDCSKVEQGSIEERVCKSDLLSNLDNTLVSVYQAAMQKTDTEGANYLKTEERGWIKGRNECWKSEDIDECIQNQYEYRIAELQAKYRLVAANGPHMYSCDGNPQNVVTVDFFETQPPVLIAERGDEVSLMYLQQSGSGTKYIGRNESFWEHQGEATVVWGYGTKEMHCRKQ